MRVSAACPHTDLLNKKKDNTYKRKQYEHNGKSFEEYFENSKKELVNMNSKNIALKHMQMHIGIKYMHFSS